MVDNHGYLIAFYIYTGAKIRKRTGASSVAERMRNLIQMSKSKHSAATEVVLNFEKILSPEKSHLLVFDNFFSSLELAAKLIEKKRWFIGTIRPDRAKFLFQAIHQNPFFSKTKTGDYDFLYNEELGVTAAAWVDTALVHFLSNVGDPKIATKRTKRVRGTGALKPIKFPQIAKIYRANYGFVDRFDKLHIAMRLHHRSVKWYRAVFWSLLKFCVVNTMATWNVLHPQKKMSQKQILLSILQEFMSVKKPPQLLPTAGGHWPTKQLTKKRCTVCKGNSSTIYSCTACKVPLHPSCFKSFHEQ
jgi:hypothetical protein